MARDSQPPDRFRGLVPVPSAPITSLQIGAVTLRAGDVLTLEESEYKFGAGRLVLEVETIYATIYATDGTWVTVSGSQRDWRGERVGPRTVQVLVSALARAMRPPSGAP